MSFDLAAHVFRLPEQLRILKLALTFFENTPIYELPPSPPFKGTGVYALYYQGDFAPYALLGIANLKARRIPIYVGKAVARGWRTGRESGAEGVELANRLREHARSIHQTTNLKVEHFSCRFMILTGEEASLISSVEAALTRRYWPLWNTSVDGFGNHDPGSGRYDQAVSEWDALHTGRGWVAKLTGARPDPASIMLRVQQHLAAQAVRLAAADDLAEAEGDAAPPE